MPAGGADLFFDQIKIIQQPFGRRRDSPILFSCLGDQVVGVKKNPFVLIEPGQQPISAAARCQFMPAGQRLGVALELIDAEQLGAQRLLVRGEPGPAAQMSVAVPRRELTDDFTD
jgi:hypothetical protein